MNRAKLKIVVTDVKEQKRALIKVAALLILTTVLMVRGQHTAHVAIGIHENIQQGEVILLYKKYGSRT